MRDAVIGRVLVASLHQGISDLLPTRLTFYESWLDAEGLREGTIGLAPLYAVLSFLRQEGDGAYEKITTCAGEYAAEWTVESMAPLERTLIRKAPAWLRTRLLLRLLGRLVQKSYTGSRAVSRLRRGQSPGRSARVRLCTVREPLTRPLCGFYRGVHATPQAVRFVSERGNRFLPGHGATRLFVDIRPADSRSRNGTA